MKKRRPAERDPDLRLSRIYEFERSNYVFARTDKDVPYRLPPHWRAGDAGDPEGMPLPSVWRRLSAQCRRLKIDPAHLLQWSLSLDTVLLGAPPEPNQLLERGRVEAYREHLRKEKALVTLALQIQTRLTESEVSSLCHIHKWSQPDACAHVLLDPQLALGALFRYCAGRHWGGERNLKIAARFEDRAAVQFEHRREAYIECWPGAVPADFPARARRIYDSLLG